MFDTVAISATYSKFPSLDLLEKNDCKKSIRKSDGKMFKAVINGRRGDKEPRITLTLTPKAFCVLRVEVSPGEWLTGSNLNLLDETNIKDFFQDLSDFVGYKTGIIFQPSLERIARLDVTKDFDLSPEQWFPIIKVLQNLDLPKYDRKTFNDSGITFVNKGRIKNKQYEIYDKCQELIDKKADQTEIENAKNLYRLEIQYKTNTAVTNLSKSLGKKNHTAKTMLTREIYEAVISRAMKLLNLDVLLSGCKSNLEILAKSFHSSRPLILAGHLFYKEHYGKDYAKILGIDLKDETLKKYERDCVKTGVLSL